MSTTFIQLVSYFLYCRNNNTSLLHGCNYVLQETSPIYSILIVVWSLNDDNGTQRSIQSTNLTLKLSANLDAITSSVENSELHNNWTIATVVFLFTFLVVTITMIVIVLTIWMWKVRAGWKKKVQDALASSHSYKSRQISKTTNRGKIRRNSVVIKDITTSFVRRTQSAIGFSATAEKYFRERHNNISFQSNQAVSLPISKCRSMPDLSRFENNASIEELMLEPRRNLNTVHTRVKILNSNPIKSKKNSNIARKRLLKTNTVDNLCTGHRQEIAPKLNNCIVAEHKLNTEKEKEKKELALLAVCNMPASCTTIKSQMT